MIIDTLNDILGKRADPETAIKIKKLITEEPEVRGAYDLFINNYGPDKNYASVHIELPDTMTVEEVDILTRRLQRKLLNKMGVILTGVGVYSYNTQNDEIGNIRNNIMEKVMNHNWALQVHGFFVNLDKKEIRFDVVMSFDIDHKECIEILKKEVKELYPNYHIDIVSDIDLTE